MWDKKCIPRFVMNEEANRVMAAYGKKKYERLVALKNKYDPTSRIVTDFAETYWMNCIQQ